MKFRILILEDNIELLNLLCIELQTEYEITSTCTLQGFKTELLNKNDLYLLDLSLPDGNSIEYIKQIKILHPNSYVIVISGDVDIKTKLTAFDLKCDDYICKPFDIEELRARINRFLKFFKKNTNKEFTIDETNKRIFFNAKDLKLRKKEFDILKHLIKNRNTLVTRDALLNILWDNKCVNENTIDVHIRNIRKKLGRKKGKIIIRTIYGLGYKLKI